MDKLLRCSVMIGFIGVTIANPAAQAGENSSFVRSGGFANSAEDNLLIAQQPRASVSALSLEALSSYSLSAMEKVAVKRTIVAQQPEIIASVPPLDRGFHTLVLNCGKLEQAQRNLNEAPTHGAQLLPALPGGNDAGSPAASGAEIYHIRQNQGRMAALAQKFNCVDR